MRLVQLASKETALRGATPQAQASQFMSGSQLSGVGSRTVLIQRIETAFGAPRVQTRWRPRLSEIKRLAKKLGANTQGLAYAMLGRDP